MLLRLAYPSHQVNAASWDYDPLADDIIGLHFMTKSNYAYLQ